MEMPPSIMTKRLESIFILDVSKLSRLINVIEGRFKSLDKTTISNFKITTKKGKNISSVNVNSILEQDNAVNNPINSLLIEFQDTEDDPLNLCSVFYDKDDSDVSIKIKCENTKWGNELFAEIEEQVERSFVNNFIYSIKNQAKLYTLTLPVLTLFTMLIMLPLFSTTTKIEAELHDNLTNSEIQYLLDEAKNSGGNQDKINFLYEVQLKKLQNFSKSVNSDKNKIIFLDQLKAFLNIKFAFLVLPILVVVLGIIYLFTRCYPGSMFLWGDFDDYYKNIVERRNFLWNTVVVALLVGVIANLFVFGFSQYL